MAISDVIITKPGPGSIAEALESNVPMILDQTCGTIWWEEMNVSFVVSHGFGESLTSFKEFATIFPKYITDGPFIQGIKQRMQEFKRERFDMRIRPLVQEMLAMNTPGTVPGGAPLTVQP